MTIAVALCHIHGAVTSLERVGYLFRGMPRFPLLRGRHVSGLRGRVGRSSGSEQPVQYCRPDVAPAPMMWHVNEPHHVLGEPGRLQNICGEVQRLSPGITGEQCKLVIDLNLDDGAGVVGWTGFPFIAQRLEVPGLSDELNKLPGCTQPSEQPAVAFCGPSLLLKSEPVNDNGTLYGIN